MALEDIVFLVAVGGPLLFGVVFVLGMLAMVLEDRRP